MKLTVESNIDDVIDSIDDVQEDIRSELRKRVGRAMAILRQRVRTYVQTDSDWTGDLHRSIKKDTTVVDDETLSFSVYTDATIAPHAALVEYGTGDRGNPTEVWQGSASLSDKASNKPADYPYDSPSIDYNEADPFNLTGYAGFAGLVSTIQTWMETKPVAPQKGNVFTSAVLISRSIIENGTYGHPFMRPAWFETELQIKKAASNALRNAVR
ncbi:hypothetical protein HAPG_00010 [Halorubrum phage GNf2]|nr:hypothetical protein HAPG_00010 [Halorubrum phage GNf2]